MADGFKLTTIKGYDFFEVSSAMQKSIRRGLEKDAMYWAVELYDSGYAEYVWKRLFIIVCEDIGLAVPTAPVVIQNLYQIYNYLVGKNDKKKSEKMPFTQAVIYMTRCKKSRIVDWGLNYYWDGHYIEDKEIPDYAIDIHSRKGRKMGKTIDDFFDVGSLLNNHSVLPLEEEYRDECRKRWTSRELLDKIKSSAKIYFEAWIYKKKGNVEVKGGAAQGKLM